MKALEIEAWTLRVLDRARAGNVAEDALVELKAVWPDPRKAARQLAGHANAARGAPILWIVGVDEKLGVKGVSFNELSSWHAQVQAEFDGIPPTLDNLNDAYENVTVAALCFDTGRAPYVVRNPAFTTAGGGAVSLEVPWREGTRTRSATHADLIRILVPIRLQPTLEVLRGTLHVKKEEEKDALTRALHAFVEFYIAPQTEQILVFPFHKMTATAAGVEPNTILRFGSIRFSDASKRIRIPLVTSFSEQRSVTVNARNEPIEITGSELIVRGPRKLVFHADAQVFDFPVEEIPDLRFDLSLVAAQDEVQCGFSVLFRRRSGDEEQSPTWDFSQGSEMTSP